MTRDEVRSRLIAELTRVVGAILEASSSSRPAAPRSGDGFVAKIAAQPDDRGEVRVYFARAGAEALAKAMQTQATDVTDDVVIECLAEVCTKALTGLESRLPDVTLSVESVVPTDMLPGPPEASAVEIVLKGQEMPLHVTLSGGFTAAASAETPGSSRTLDVILDIDLPLVVRFGRTELPLKMLTAIGPGSVIDLGRSPDDLVDVLISNRVVARGEVVIVGGNYGVRVRDVVSAAERARTLEAELA